MRSPVRHSSLAQDRESSPAEAQSSHTMPRLFLFIREAAEIPISIIAAFASTISRRPPRSRARSSRSAAHEIYNEIVAVVSQSAARKHTVARKKRISCTAVARRQMDMPQLNVPPPLARRWPPVDFIDPPADEWSI